MIQDRELAVYISERIHSAGVNFVVENEFFTEDLEQLFFHGEKCARLAPGKDMLDVLVAAGVFSSRGQARKNWTRSGAEIPEGFSDFLGIGKARLRISVLRPTSENVVDRAYRRLIDV